MRTPIIAGNWKMFKNRGEAATFAQSVRGSLGSVTGVEMVICASFTLLDRLVQEFAGSNIGVGAQNMYFAEEGAFTGEVSPSMLTDLGVQYVVIGHSERRAYFAETDETVNQKIKAALKHQLVPIVCVGENLAEREGNKTIEVVETQTKAAFAGLSAEQAAKVVIAYEPIWAIGTGKTASAADANEVCGEIRRVIGELYGSSIAEAIRIQYGGSVKPDNIVALMSEEHIDGALVGGASLDPASYEALVRGALEGVSV